jgi:hypothetical protein
VNTDKRIVWEGFATGASGDIEIEREFLRVMGDAYDKFCEKQRDYGRGNISKRGELGVAVRLGDKVERLNHLLSQRYPPANEPISDTWIDTCVYGAIGLMCHRGTWLPPKD